jgi:Domain of unknown function (DUF4352)
MTFTLSRRTLLILGFIVAIAVGVGIGAIVFAGGGGDSTTVTAADSESGRAGSENQGEVEIDGGLADSEEGDCDEKGINGEERKEGSCSEDGQKLVVVNKGSTLELKSLDAKLLGIQANESLGSEYESETASGTYLTAELAITNKTHGPAEFEESQCTLLIDNNVYTQDFEVQNGTEQRSFLWSVEGGIPAQGTVTGTVTFDVPPKVAKRVGKAGNIDISNFGEEVGNANELGIIRTYG